MNLIVGLPTMVAGYLFSLGATCGNISKTQIKITPKKDSID